MKKKKVPQSIKDIETFLYLKYGENGKFAKTLTWIIRKALKNGTNKGFGVGTLLLYDKKISKTFVREVETLNQFIKGRDNLYLECTYEVGATFLMATIDKRYKTIFLKYESSEVQNTKPINYWGKYGVKK